MPVQLCVYLDKTRVDTTSVNSVIDAAKGRVKYRQLMHFVLFAELLKGEDAPIEVANWALIGNSYLL